MPWAIANASYKQQKRNKGVTEIVEMPGRGHALTIDSGWREVADTALELREALRRGAGRDPGRPLVASRGRARVPIRRRVPPGQYVEDGLPGAVGRPDAVRDARPVAFSVASEVEEPRLAGRGTELKALPHETITVDIHCVTKWSKLDTAWSGVSLDVLLEASSTDRRLTSWPSATAATRPTCRSRT